MLRQNSSASSRKLVKEKPCTDRGPKILSTTKSAGGRLSKTNVDKDRAVFEDANETRAPHPLESQAQPQHYTNAQVKPTSSSTARAANAGIVKLDAEAISDAQLLASQVIKDAIERDPTLGVEKNIEVTPVTRSVQTKQSSISSTSSVETQTNAVEIGVQWKAETDVKDCANVGVTETMAQELENNKEENVTLGPIVSHMASQGQPPAFLSRKGERSLCPVSVSVSVSVGKQRTSCRILTWQATQSMKMWQPRDVFESNVLLRAE